MVEFSLSPWLMVAIVSGLFTALGLVIHVLLLFRHLNVEAFCAQIKKLLIADNAPRAVKLCSVAPKTAVVRLTLALLGLEIPSKGQSPDPQQGGYRDGAAVPDFGAEARARVDAEVRAMRRVRWRIVLLALGAFLVGLALGAVAVFSFMLTAPAAGASPGNAPLAAVPYAVAGAPLLGAFLVVKFWFKWSKDLETTVETLLPLLQPAEEMSASAREAAAKARKLHPG